jgi:AcrR family transcriptional regulator
MSLFLQKSYRDVTMNEIVTKTGLSKGAFYHYFSSKEELFREILYMFFSMGEIQYKNIKHNTFKGFYSAYVEKINQGIEQINLMMQDTDSRPANFMLIMFEAAARMPEFLEKELEMHKNDIKAWVEVIADARKNGEIASRSTDKEIANLFLYCNDGVFMRYLNNNTKESFGQLLQKTYDIIYNNLKT